MTLFSDRWLLLLPVAIGVQHREVPNLGASWRRFLTVTYSNDGVSAVIGVQHTEVANLGSSWSRFLAVTLMMV